MTYWVGDYSPEPRLLKRNVRELVVFERHLGDPFASWKIVGKMENSIFA